jgi:hypothetical protein
VQDRMQIACLSPPPLHHAFLSSPDLTKNSPPLARVPTRILAHQVADLMRDLAKAHRRVGQLEREGLQASVLLIFVPLMVLQTGVQADPDSANTLLAELLNWK